MHKLNADCHGYISRKNRPWLRIIQH